MTIHKVLVQVVLVAGTDEETIAYEELLRDGLALVRSQDIPDGRFQFPDVGAGDRVTVSYCWPREPAVAVREAI